MYDSYIYCTTDSRMLPTFEYIIKIPDMGWRNKLFVVRLTDSFTTVSYFVTTYSYSSSLIQNNRLNLFSIDTESTTMKPTAFYIMMTCFLILCVSLAVIYVLIQCKTILIVPIYSVVNQCYYRVTKQRLMVALYILFKLIYSVVFSLSMLILLIRLVCGTDLDLVGELPEYHMEIRRTVERNIRAITEFKKVELNRQYDMKWERLVSCEFIRG